MDFKWLMMIMVGVIVRDDDDTDDINGNILPSSWTKERTTCKVHLEEYTREG